MQSVPGQLEGARLGLVPQTPKEIINSFSELWAAFVSQYLCDAPFPGGSLTTREPAEYSWMSGNPTALMKIG